MKNKDNINKIDLTNKDNVNKEIAINSFRMQNYKNSKNITLGVTLTFLGLTIASLALILTGVASFSIGGALALITAMASATGASLFAKKQSQYNKCVEKNEYYAQVQTQLERNKVAQLEAQKKAEKERLRKEQKEKEAKKKTNKQLLKEGKIKFTNKYRKPSKEVKRFSDTSKEDGTFTSTPTSKMELAEKKKEQIKDITSFLDSGK